MIQKLFVKYLDSISPQLPLNLVVHHSNGSIQTVGIGGPKVELHIQNSKLYQGLMLNPSKAFGEGYASEQLEIPTNNMFEFLRGLWTTASLPQSSRWLGNLKKLFSNFSIGNTIDKAKKNVTDHYDKFHRIVSLAVDKETHLYSCAFFKNPDMTLGQAQICKADRTLTKLDLSEGKKVLEIGCGYGFITRRATAKFKTDVTGITPSVEQYKTATALAEQENLNVKILNADYREVNGQFDSIYSIGMFEHVGAKHWLTYFKKVASLLKKRGLFVLHTETQKSPQKMDPFISKYIFPGSQQPTPRQVLAAAEASGLRFHHAESWKPHYKKTLLAWASNLASKKQLVPALYDNEKEAKWFYRLWEVYLYGCAASFDVEAGMGLEQFLFSNARTDWDAAMLAL